MDDKTNIAGLKKVCDWKALKVKLINEPTDILWEQAFEDFLLARITTRYFEPINAISSIHKQQGKGFSIVAIYCSLIEFFETLKKGYEFKYPNYYDSNGSIVASKVNHDKKGNFYSLHTKEIFTDFLTENLPFSVIFKNLNIAEDFYTNVRCSILHQAETQSNWVIRDGESSDDIVFWNSSSTRPEIILRWKLYLNGMRYAKFKFIYFGRVVFYFIIQS
ncbi:hypothetical protein [Larkinella sp. C7]|uniref:hypothetical protein n=1 Tax=Larkinella sp. C7 TaxID=2576607 RepID=UPI0011115D3D|nr:hypothetical protein [Larkinella sp. C7]